MFDYYDKLLFLKNLIKDKHDMSYLSGIIVISL